MSSSSTAPLNRESRKRNFESMLETASPHVALHSLVLPCETGAMKQIFEAEERCLPDALPKTVLVAMPLSAENLSRVGEFEPVRLLSRKGCFFDKFVVAEFACKPALSLEERMCMVCERFELILSHAFDASSLGRTIKHLDRGERIGFVQEALGGKAYATLKARAGTAARLIAWAQEHNRSAFPIDSTILAAFTEHVVRSGGKYSAMSAVLETVRFLHFVLGVDCDLQALKHPLVQGRLRKCRLERKPRHQARPFSVEEVAALERFVRDSSKSAIDRYAAGSMLFAVMGRARLGDLKSVKSFICDFNPEDGSGYVEVVSLSHKTRTFGNALGLELPIVAPAVGVSQGSWAEAWVGFRKRPVVMWRSLRMASPFCKLHCRMAVGPQGRSAMISFPAGSGRS